MTFYIKSGNKFQIAPEDSLDGKIVYANSDSKKLMLTRMKTQMINFKDLLV